MVLMAIDHVRVYSGLPAGGPEPGIFFTRWVTHFCAPGFAFFAGTSAFLYGDRIGNMGTLSRFLLTRGLLLVVLELTLIRLFWAFNLNLQHFMLAGVIWMLGWFMVLMAALVYLWSTSLEAVKTLVDAGARLDLADRIYEGTPLGWAEYGLNGEETSPEAREKLAAIVAYLRDAASKY